MAQFKIDGRMKVKTLIEDFKKEFGGILHVKDGAKIADNEATLASIRSNDKAKGGELICRANRTVEKFKQELWDTFGIKVNVFSPDDWVAVLDGITLNKIKDIPKQATKDGMESLVAYKREGALSGNTVAFGKYTISIEDSGSVIVESDGEVASNTKEALRNIAEECNFEYNPDWTTRQFGKNLMTFLTNNNNNNNNNSAINTDNETKAMRTVEVTITGTMVYLGAYNEDGYIDHHGRFLVDWVENDLVFTIDGVEYSTDDFAEGDYGNDDFEVNGRVFGEVDAAKFFEEVGATEGIRSVCESFCDSWIEIPEDEDFDPEKAHIVCRDFIYPDHTDEPTLVAFVYDGEVYPQCCYPEGLGGDHEKKIWPVED